MAEPNMSAVIFDIDGTLADTEHRKRHVEQRPKDWKSWNAAMHLDGQRPAIIKLAQELSKTHRLLLCTGRQEEHRKVTCKWLAETADLWFSELYMRATGDYRDDAIVKSEMLDRILADGFKPWLVVDDRSKVVTMWRERGLDCLQCAPGDF